MGIPKYFRWLTNKYDDLIIKSDTIKIDNLFLDANCLIHPCCRKILKDNPDLIKFHEEDYKLNKYNINTDINIISKLEKCMFEEILDYVSYLTDFVKPTKLLYVSIDGIAPRAKMEQQRLRRYRSSKEKRLIDNIHLKFNKSLDTYWDTNAITPGTLFMLKLSHYLQKKLTEKLKPTYSIILSDTSVPGEGEHKIVDYIRKGDINDVGCIYGLDADLIMLSLCLDSKIYLLREAVNYGKVDMETLLYFSIELLKKYIIEEIRLKLTIEDFELSNNIIIDYVFLCFLVGNDFLPTLINLDINENSINSLVMIYIKIFSIRKNYLINDSKIDFTFLNQILSHLYNSEDHHLLKLQASINKRKIYKKYYNSPFERELDTLKHYPLLFKYKKSNVNLGKEGWQTDYYKYYFNIDNSIDSNEFISSVCKTYMEGLEWTLNYYTKGCPSWKWYYPFRSSPCLRDLVIYTSERVYGTEFEESSPYTPLEQLVLVIPKQSFNLIPKEYKDVLIKDISISNYYPDDFELDMENKLWFHECNPIIPIINDKVILNKLSKLKLNNIDQSRNIISKEPIVLFKL